MCHGVTTRSADQTAVKPRRSAVWAASVSTSGVAARPEIGRNTPTSMARDRHSTAATCQSSGRPNSSIRPIYWLSCKEVRRDLLVERGLVLYRDVSRVLHERGAPAWLQTELTFAQLRALFTLADYGPTPIGRVARRLGIGLPAAGSLVDRLVEQGLVKRREDPLDRRRTLAETTGAGQALAQRLRQGSREALRAWLEQMDGDDLAALVRGLEALFAIGGSSGGHLLDGDRVGV